ncbi:MAG: DUF2254 domain-containing protein [Acidobacteriota bacterium]|nr:DUF2254 domain-containing protein [Acidobacteriota bacterium]
MRVRTLKGQLVRYWERIRYSFWFLPSTMAVAAVALSFWTVALDRTLSDGSLKGLRWAYSGGAEGASAVLQTIAGSMITIAGVVFSLTLVALSLASSQFGPRLLRSFMRDTANQLVLGTFVATFLYCLLVLRTIRRADETAFVPHLSVTIGALLAIASLGVLIYFVHHVSVSIQADEIIARVGAELVDGIERLFPEQIGEGLPSAQVLPAAGRLPEDFGRKASTVPAAEDGYLQFIDAEALMALAIREDAVIRVERRPGQYLILGDPLVSVRTGNVVDTKFSDAVNAAFVVGTQRTTFQDVEFPIDELVEIAARALSPGVNDPFTAMACVDRLGSALCRLARRDLPGPCRFDEQHKLRVFAPAVTFSGLLNRSFDQIRQNARTNAAVSVRLLETLLSIARAADRPEDKASVRRQAEMVARGAEDLPEEEDRRALRERHQAMEPALRAHAG